MAIYSVGFDKQELSKVGLEANKLLSGQELTYDKKLITFTSVFSYEGEEECDREETDILPGDTVIASCWTPFIYIERMRQDKIKVVVLETEHGSIIKVISS
jgi:hypothetical protein